MAGEGGGRPINEKGFWGEDAFLFRVLKDMKRVQTLQGNCCYKVDMANGTWMDTLAEVSNTLHDFDSLRAAG